MKLNQLLYLPLWYFKIRFLKKQIPLQTVIFITNECNYNCKHCCVDKTKPHSMTYDEIKEHLINSYNLGSRFVDFEGGEGGRGKYMGKYGGGKYKKGSHVSPDDTKGEYKTINDLCTLAKSIGFYSTTVTTNASYDFSYFNADHVFISLDGIKAHDIIRGEGAFEKLKENIAKFPHPERVSANMVINRINQDEVADVLKFVEQSPYINGISFNFYNPVNGDTQLCVNDREKIINTIIGYKKRGYKVLNTEKGLKYLIKPDFKKVCWITNFITLDGKQHSGCPDKTPCSTCGLGMAGEMRALYDLSPQTIIAGLKLRMN